MVRRAGLRGATAIIAVAGVCGSGIIETIAEMYLAGIISSGVVDGTLAGAPPRIGAVGRTFAYVLNEGPPRLLIYQTDVRAIQLAKAALYAGAKLLIERARRRAGAITLAGAFGNHIDPLYAMVLGLIPDCDLAKVTSAGNAAGTGARIALLNLASRADRERRAGHREDRDGDRAELPAAVRRRDGDPEQGRCVPAPG